ncbi:MAG TPA: UpxY family transcription antiterminator [Bryobacteraceae bacterium]|nr:UpxY family transcription antiterminator [Bryobacteraceae bacterium]
MPDLCVTDENRPVKRWFALVVKQQREKAVAETLRRLEIETFLPAVRLMRRWSDRMKTMDVPIFPGYVFCQCGFDSRLAVLRTPGVSAFVSFGNGPATVPDEEIEAVRNIVNSGLPATDGPYVMAGERVRIVSGPLAGLEGILHRERDVRRVVVNVEILRRSVSVEVERDAISTAAANKVR